MTLLINNTDELSMILQGGVQYAGQEVIQLRPLAKNALLGFERHILAGL